MNSPVFSGRIAAFHVNARYCTTRPPENVVELSRNGPENAPTRRPSIADGGTSVASATFSAITCSVICSPSFATPVESFAVTRGSALWANAQSTKATRAAAARSA